MALIGVMSSGFNEPKEYIQIDPPEEPDIVCGECDCFEPCPCQCGWGWCREIADFVQEGDSC